MWAVFENFHKGPPFEMTHKTILFIGPTGLGKSSISQLFGGKGSPSSRPGHGTTYQCVTKTNDFYLIDTIGSIGHSLSFEPPRLFDLTVDPQSEGQKLENFEIPEGTELTLRNVHLPIIGVLDALGIERIDMVLWFMDSGKNRGIQGADAQFLYNLGGKGIFEYIL